MVPNNKIRIFYLLSFLGGFYFNIVAPLFIIFGFSLGFTIAQIGILLGACRFSIFIFEIPTGIFADSYGRKKSVLLCYFLSIFSSFIYFFSSNFYFLLFGSVINGLALTFMSGAFEALLVDSLKLSDQESFSNKVFVRLGVVSTLGFITGGLIGSGIAYFNLRYIWLLQSVIAILAFILSWKFLEEKFYPREILIEQKNFIEIIFSKIKNPLTSIFCNKQIFLMFFIAILMALASALYLISWPIIFKDLLSIPIYYFGLISSVAGFFFLGGSLLAEKFSLEKGTVNTLLFFLFLMGLLFAIFGFSKSIVLSLGSFILIDFFNGGFMPLFYSLLNKFIPSPQRATILSFYSLAGEGSSGIGEIIAGGLLTIFIAPDIVLLSSILILLVLILFFKLKNKFIEMK